VTIPPGETRSLPVVTGGKAAFEWSTRVPDVRECALWSHPERAHNAWRFFLLDVSVDGEPSILVPLRDFIGSGPGVNPRENLFFTVDATGMMTSRLLILSAP
jgi:hypothetical protein